MLISEKLTKEMNAQVGRELAASNQYVNIAAYFDSESLPELAAFFYRQADEERVHAMKFVHYVVEAGGKAAVPAVDEPTAAIESAEHAAKLSLEWELEVTSQINNLMSMAIDEKDFIAQDFLRWFVNEQLEEVSTMDQLLSVIRRAGEGGLLFVEDFLVRLGDPHEGEGAE
jgi:ferritin